MFDVSEAAYAVSGKPDWPRVFNALAIAYNKHVAEANGAVPVRVGPRLVSLRALLCAMEGACP